jgi:hypothetical protein
LKPFSLFAAFTNRPDVKELLGESHSYIMDTYIAITWMTKKEKFLFYNRLTTRNVNQCTSCLAEYENSSMKWGEMVVNPQQHMHQTVHTLNKTSNSRFTVEEGHDAKNLKATQNLHHLCCKHNFTVIQCRIPRNGKIVFHLSIP